jgi:hypothetical protein
MTTPTIASYLEGDTTPTQAARALLLDLGEIESDLKPLEAQRKETREALAAALEQCDGRRYTIPGFATARLAEPAAVKRWNESRLARLCAWLRETDREEVAEMIENCREDTFRAGGLRVDPDRSLKG